MYQEGDKSPIGRNWGIVNLSEMVAKGSNSGSRTRFLAANTRKLTRRSCTSEDSPQPDAGTSRISQCQGDDDLDH